MNIKGELKKTLDKLPAKPKELGDEVKHRAGDVASTSKKVLGGLAERGKSAVSHLPRRPR
jgi:hypothetical protein